MQDLQQILQDNLTAVQERINKAADKASRDAAEIRLVGVTKYVDLQVTRAFVEAGCHELGESRPQNLWPKAEALAEHPITWHQIGHLQRCLLYTSPSPRDS